MCTALFPDLYESSATTKARYRTPARARKHTIHTLCASLSLCPRPHLFPCSLFLSLLSHTRARKHTHTYTRTVELQPGADSCRAVSPHRCGRHGDNTSVPVTRDRPKGSFPSGTPPRQGVWGGSQGGRKIWFSMRLITRSNIYSCLTYTAPKLYAPKNEAGRGLCSTPVHAQKVNRICSHGHGRSHGRSHPCIRKGTSGRNSTQHQGQYQHQPQYE